MNYLIVGLGNIGAEYANTRHNMGFMVLDALAKASSIEFKRKRYGKMAELPDKGNILYLLKPSTYMNLSGNAVRHWVRKMKLPLEQLLIISDDLNLPFGTLRLRKSGSAGGHNGLSNISDLLESQDYARLRVGIGSDFNPGGQIDFVLGELSETEKEQLGGICEKAIEGIKLFTSVGAERAMNIVNTNAK